MKKIISVLLLILLVAGIASSYEYHMPVNIKATMNPEVLLPGDEAILTIELANGAASYGAGKDSGAGSSASGTVLSTPLNKTFLLSAPEIKVLTDDISDIGMIGPNDKLEVYYKIRAEDNISSGTHLMDFKVLGGYDMTTINREIPIKVDDTSVAMARAETDATTFNLNVANPRENTLNAVTIIPSAKGIIFSPDEYYIGTMDPDEVFTISFGIASDSIGKTMQGSTNLSFTAKFKNGDNWHTSEPYVTKYTPPKITSNQNSYLLPAGAVAAIVLIVGVYLYRRRIQNGKNGKSQKENRTV
jgi:hypothetical protein